ncbi:hypothetical protein A6A03_01365 [Chloroflexus islandicus]|uniref:Pilus assembly protein n=1 Tax=Chloroflexus islandicus TaxID=1707952 RepID=A0A178MAX7_9CHLR|nr:Flp family type IVb pilin [Chloroflexus islandicus]OAN45940.1 hypothetical protein A6A03_01365 [Chloroflexus islandicus]
MSINHWLQTVRVAVTHHERGQGLVEYSLIIMLIALVVVAAVSTLGNTLSDMYNIVADIFR